MGSPWSMAPIRPRPGSGACPSSRRCWYPPRGRRRRTGPLPANWRKTTGRCGTRSRTTSAMAARSPRGERGNLRGEANVWRVARALAARRPPAAPGLRARGGGRGAGSARAGQVRLRGHGRLRLPYGAEGRRQRGRPQVRRPVRHGVLEQHHSRPEDGDRELDGRADHHRRPPGPAAQRRAHPPRASVHVVQRYGRGRSDRAGEVPAQRASREQAHAAEEDHHSHVRERVPARLAHDLRLQGDAAGPRSALTMALDTSRFLAGNTKKTGPEGQATPNLTPDKGTGLDWSEEQIVTYLQTGNRPDGDVAGGLMGEMIQGTAAGYKDMTKADLQAIARFLKSIPAVKNKID